MSVERDIKLLNVTIALKEIPNENGRVGLGVRFEEDKTVTTDPKVKFIHQILAALGRSNVHA